MSTVTEGTDEMRRLESDLPKSATELYRLYFRAGDGFIVPRFGHITVEATDQQDAVGKFCDEYPDKEIVGIEKLKRGSIKTKMEILEACGLL